jgi:molybdopterin-containing oxidoreductase family iron-sulfur binding subunit
VVPDSAAAPLTFGPPKLPAIADAPAESNGLTLVLRADPCMWDGSYANNAWLQELPKPLTKQVWGNAIGLPPEEARRLGLRGGDLVRVQAGEHSVEAAVEIEPGHAAGVASLTLGYGRSRAGAIGNGVGANAYLLRRDESPWVLRNVTLHKAGRRRDILTTQNVVRAPQDLTEDELQRRFPVLSLAALAQGDRPDAQTGPLPTLLSGRPLPPAEHAWAMVIDASICIGCNACVIACQAENNVPVVGPEEVARGRQMHWLRVDVYDHGTAERPEPGFQPVPCMHCEHAPCEPVCPVAASVHDGEGLNVQVYNRCIGTRFCQANCPYKVRRFNFFGYADGQEYANLGFDPYKAQKNPEVTVRARGVMEKCTYCVQRISAARRASERNHSPIAADEVTTACQDACPTRAIVFGDLAEPNAEVNERKRDARHYALLGHLGTRPRTTYLARLRNPNSAVGGGA